MNIRKLWSVGFGLVIGCAAFLPSARASEVNQQTKVTFSQPVEIPGQILPAGAYMFVLTGDTFNPNVVRITSLDGKRVFATVFTVATERAMPADGTTLTFAERPSAQPEALLKWFYPGETTGHEFEYSKPEESQLARDQQLNVEPDRMSESQTRSGF